ncbi:MAG: hypothetical protein QOG23_4646 [Blastocatellia bacterium]|jgi:hypothetical protein|nr:hypothetical protein [Blastocatellia bacterium]
MFNSQILDVAIGMIFVYLLLSLMCSAANEIIESLLKKRAKHLEQGLRELLQNKELVAKVYNHSLVNGLFGGQYKPQSRKLPSYIPSENFALALMDLVLPGQAGSATAKSGAADAMISSTPSSSPPVMINVGGSPASGAAAPAPTVGVTAPAAKPNPLDPLRNALQSFPYTEVRQALLPLVDAAGNDAAKARQNIEDWFNSSMDRVSGWYKRRAQVMLLVIGLIVTMGVNADSIIVAKRLASDRALRESVVAAADAYAKENAKAASSTPSPTPTPAATPKPSGSPAAKPSATPIAAASAPTPKPSVTPDPSATPDTCVKGDCADPESPKCKLKMSQCKLQELGLPIGWVLPDEPQTKWPGLHFWTLDFWTGWAVQTRIHLLGWLLTALAISLGAPFWFDMLNKLIVVRGTVKPKEKSGDEPSKS